MKGNYLMGLKLFFAIQVWSMKKPMNLLKLAKLTGGLKLLGLNTKEKNMKKDLKLLPLKQLQEMGNPLES